MLQISENRRYLVNRDGTPFFWLGDTAWELFHRLTLDEARHYLQTRRQQGFTVIQAVVLAELDGLHTPNANGDKPLLNDDPTQPVEAYFAHVDAILRIAAENDLVVGLLPTWGDKVRQQWGVGPVIFNPHNARVFGRYLGERYRQMTHIVWILGGDRNGDGFEALWRAMAQGIRDDAGHSGLITYHPQGIYSSSTWFHDEPWLDFNIIQSGHNRHADGNWKLVTMDYQREPIKPVLVGEPCYEDIPEFLRGDDYMNAYDSRQAGYRAIFSGAFGHTYGHNAIWQMLSPAHQPVIHIDPGITWQQALERPGGQQMQHLRRLLESRPFLNRIPDQGILADDSGYGADHIRATRDQAGSYGFVYLPRSRSDIGLRTNWLTGDQVSAWWYDPRQGSAAHIGILAKEPIMRFRLPTYGNDWVLVVDDAARNYPVPGTGASNA
jgi:hypothetical protein